MDRSAQKIYHKGDWVRVKGRSQNPHGHVGQIISDPIPDYEGYAYRIQISYQAGLVINEHYLEPIGEQTAIDPGLVQCCPTCGQEIK